eukprot:420506-Pelagomonas_calceolata.AAC.2
MQFEWPSMDKLKQPSLSPDKLSAPQHITMAPGWYISITCSTMRSAETMRMEGTAHLHHLQHNAQRWTMRLEGKARLHLLQHNA